MERLTPVRFLAGAALVTGAIGVAAIFTVGYELRGPRYDECAAAQPWWTSSAVLVVPALAVVSEILVFAGWAPTRTSRVTRAATAVAATATLLWFGWYLLTLIGLSFGCGWF